MAYFEWTPQLDVGVESMNDQHHRLIDLMNVLHERAASGASRAELGGFLESLAEYTVRHFRAEESLMASIGYPELERHKRIHEELLRTFGEHRSAFDGGGELGAGFFSFLKLWLSAHIKGIDRKYGAHTAARAGHAA